MNQTLLGLAFILLSASTGARVPGVEHVVVIGVDGLGGRTGFKGTNAPVLRELMRRGAYTLKARGVMPTSSSPNWASMIMGAGPEQHGVTSNDWLTNRFEFPPVVSGSGGMFPSVFGLLRAQRPAFEIGAIYDWGDFGRLFERAAANVSEHVKGSPLTARRAIDYLTSKKPSFLFIHFDDVDHAGHAFGWESWQYMKAVDMADSLIGDILAALDAVGMQDKTLVLVSSDHGGRETKHGGNSIEELEIPWIIAGPGVAAGRELRNPVSTCDTAATIAWAFGVAPPEVWTGRPVREAFQ